MRRQLTLLAVTVFCAASFNVRSNEPGVIELHPENPHYFRWRDRPAILITSGEHYGAVLNREFDYVRYLEELKAHGFNLTRIFSGTYREVPGSFSITGNTLAPARGQFLCPWARSATPGASDGGHKFDLTRWDEEYFARMKDFIRRADARGVVVELVFFCTMYFEDVWRASPMFIGNNVNGIGEVGRQEVYGGRDPALLAVQRAVVERLVRELNAFDNLYYEICNEPYERGGLTREWNDQMIDTIVATEAGLPKKHLIAQGFPRSAKRIHELNPRVSILNFHAERPRAVRLNDSHNRVVAMDETGGADRTDLKYRTEGWSWILSGGAVYNHLDFSFTTDHPDGSAFPLPPGTPGGGGPALRKQLQVLKQFIERFEFVRMTPDGAAILDARILGLTARRNSDAEPAAHVLSEPGRAWAIYVPGGTQAELDLNLPAGGYHAEWLSPLSGGVLERQDFRHEGGSRTVRSPEYAEDIALRVVRRGGHE
jgi:hypothetical protein